MKYEILKELCLIEINKINININTKRYKPVYTNEYYLNLIFIMLNDINNWYFLSELKQYNSNKKYHYKTIYNKFRKWTIQGVFKNAFYNYKLQSNNNLLLIDATSINNKYGSENITINPENKKKKVTKLSIITNNNGFIYSVIPFTVKNKYKNYSTSVHDVKMIDEHIKDIKNIQNKSKYYNLIGDKAYKINDKKKLLDKNMIIITPDKKNTIIKNNKYKNNKLNKRIKIENVNSYIKKYERIMMRKERKISYFMSYVYMACILNNIICK